MKRNPCVMWLCAVAFYVYTYIMRSSVANVLNAELIEYFHSDAVGIANLVGCYYIPYALMPIPVGIIFDKYGVRQTSIWASAFCVLGFLIFLMTDKYLVAMCGQMILGIASSFAFILMLKVATTWFHADKIALLSSIGCSIGLMGPMIANPTLAALSQHYSWRIVLFAFAGIGIMLCLAVACCMHDCENSVADDAQHVSFHKILTLLYRKDLLLIGVYSMCIYASVIVFCDVWGITFLSEKYCYTTLEASCALIYVYVGSIVGAPLCAFLSHKFAYARILLIGAIGVSTSLLIINFCLVSHDILPFALFVFGIFLAFQVLVFPFAISLCPPSVSASASGIVNMLTSFAGMFLEPLFGFCLQKTVTSRDVQAVYNWDAGFVMLICAALIALFLAMRLCSTARQLEKTISA